MLGTEPRLAMYKTNVLTTVLGSPHSHFKQEEVPGHMQGQGSSCGTQARQRQITGIEPKPMLQKEGAILTTHAIQPPPPGEMAPNIQQESLHLPTLIPVYTVPAGCSYKVYWPNFGFKACHIVGGGAGI